MHRILVVDGFKPWLDAACEIIETQPKLQVIVQAGDGEEAVQLATDLKPDLVVLDIGLPRLNGLTAAVCIFKASPGTKVVFLSHNNDPEIVHAARSVGASGFVCKPKAATDLLRAIAVAIAAQRGKEFYTCPLSKLPAYTSWRPLNHLLIRAESHESLAFVLWDHELRKAAIHADQKLRNVQGPHQCFDLPSNALGPEKEGSAFR